MDGYDPSASGDQKKNYPTQNTPIVPSGGFATAGYAPSGYPAAAYPPAPGFAPAPAFQHVPPAEDEPIVKGLDFNTETIRKGFIRKVYTILSVSASFTFDEWR